MAIIATPKNKNEEKVLEDFLNTLEIGFIQELMKTTPFKRI